MEIIDAKIIRGKLLFATSTGDVWQAEGDWQTGVQLKLLAQREYKVNPHPLERFMVDL